MIKWRTVNICSRDCVRSATSNIIHIYFEQPFQAGDLGLVCKKYHFWVLFSTQFWQCQDFGCTWTQARLQHTGNMVNIPELWSIYQKYGQCTRTGSTYQKYGQHTRSAGGYHNSQLGITTRPSSDLHLTSGVNERLFADVSRIYNLKPLWAVIENHATI